MNKRQNHLTLRLESLEDRTTPATLVSPTTLTYQDADGDSVVVKFSKPILSDANANTVFKFDTGTVDGSNTLAQQLQRIDLTVIGAPAIGTNITTVATRSAVNGGDGFAALGIIKADELGLGAIAIDGDLGRVDAGDSSVLKQAIKSIAVNSWGRYGVSTQPAGNDLQSNIYGNIGPIRIKTDLVGAFLDDTGISGAKIASISIGGSILGGAANQSGVIDSGGDIGPIFIKGDVVGSIGANSGSISSGKLGRIASITIGGSLLGGIGSSSGDIDSEGDLGKLSIGGSIIGGGGVDSGTVFANQKLASVRIGRDLLGGTGQLSGAVRSNKAIETVKIAGDVIGNAPRSGFVSSFDTLASLSISGSLIGSANGNNGFVSVGGNVSAMTIRGSVVGDGIGSGVILAAGIAKLSIGGSIIGGEGDDSGFVEALISGFGTVRVTGDVRGASGDRSGRVSSEGSLTGITIGGSLTGGGGDFSGTIDALNHLGSVKIAGDVRGGGGDSSGSISGEQLLAKVTINGSVRSGTAPASGSIGSSDGSIGSIFVGGRLVGNAVNAVSIFARGQTSPVGATDLAIGSITVKGSAQFARILAGFDSPTSVKNADAQIGSVTIGGDWFASSIAAGVSSGNAFFGDGDDVKASGAGIKDEVGIVSKIQSVSIGGQVVGTASSGDFFGITAENIGVVKVGGITIPTTAGDGNDDILIGITSDFALKEI